jgi:hypothetical protein
MNKELRNAIVAGIISTIVGQLVLLGISAGLPPLLRYFGFTSPFNLIQLFQVQFPLWVVLLFASMIALTSAFYIRLTKRHNSKPFLLAVPRRPLMVLQKGVFRAFGVDWSFAFGTNNGETTYAFIENGPLCPKCKFEMDSNVKSNFLGRKNKVWICIKCGMAYDIPRDVEDVEEVVSRLIEADFRKHGLS